LAFTGGMGIPVNNPAYYGGVTVGKNINENVKPYASLMLFNPVYYFESGASQYSSGSALYLSVGMETNFYLTEERKTKFIFIPEISYPPGPFAYDEQKFHFSLTMNFGFTFDFNKSQ
jgi:hypothetical protein